MRHSLESLSHSKNLDMSRNAEGVNNPNTKKDPWDMSEFRDKMGKLNDIIDSLEMIEEAPSTVESWDNHIARANFEKYKVIWEKEKSEADMRGVNPETGLYEKGLTPVDPENTENYVSKQKIANKLASGDKLTFGESMLVRDSVVYEFNGYKLKPDHCYRKVTAAAIEYYQETGFVDNDVDLRTLNRTNGTKIKGRVDTVDWYLGATTSRYGDILLETPAKAEYFIPADKPGANLSIDPDVLHMHSSGIVEPIPMSEVKIIRNTQYDEIPLSEISDTF